MKTLIIITVVLAMITLLLKFITKVNVEALPAETKYMATLARQQGNPKWMNIFPSNILLLLYLYGISACLLTIMICVTIVVILVKIL